MSILSQREYRLFPNQCPAAPVGAAAVLIGEERRRNAFELGLLATHSVAPQREKGAIKVECQTITL